MQMIENTQFCDATELVKTWPLLFPTKQRVFSLVRDNVVPHVRIGRKVYFQLAKVDAWLANGGSALSGGWRRGPAS